VSIKLKIKNKYTIQLKGDALAIVVDLFATEPKTNMGKNHSV
jgi:hypothetical protein